MEAEKAMRFYNRCKAVAHPLTPYVMAARPPPHMSWPASEPAIHL